MSFDLAPYTKAKSLCHYRLLVLDVLLLDVVSVQDVVKSMTCMKDHPPLKENLQHHPMLKLTSHLP